MNGPVHHHTFYWQVAVSSRDDALIITAENMKSVWFRDFLRCLKVCTPCLVIVASSEHETVQNSKYSEKKYKQYLLSHKVR